MPPYPPQPGANPQNPHPQIVYMSRPMEPQEVHISPEAMRRHEESKKKYPHLNLSTGEYIISAVDRHPIGLFQIWGAIGLVIALVLGAVALLSGTLTELGTGYDGEGLSPAMLAIPASLVILLTLVFGFIAHGIYVANKFFLTNESVIQQIQVGLFHKREQTVSLANIEDASYTQQGLLPHVLDYGMIRLSTEGDETTYRFNYASRPRQQVAVLNNAVEAFKNGRPVD